MDSIRQIRKRFIIIIWSISLLLIINMFYLFKLYKAIEEEVNRIMISSIEQADGEELQIRLAAISSLTDGEDMMISVDKSIVVEEEGPTSEGSGSSFSSLVVFSQLMTEVRQTVHQSIDTVIPPDLPLLDSLIIANSESKGILPLLYHSEIVDLNTNTVLSSSNQVELGKIYHTYLYEYDSDSKYAYRVYTASMTRSVLGRMSGILLTTLLTIILLGYAFWFFIRTVVRQKTLEEMKQDFSNNMTHELKTPISVAYSAVDTLLNFKQGNNKDKREQYLKICLDQLSNLRDAVERILSMSKEQSSDMILNKEEFELNSILIQIANQQKMKTEKSVDIDILVKPANMTIYADKIHFFNIISNLIDNAIRYSSENVFIRITSYLDDKQCIISIKDNGIGINKENIKHIFEKFYRVPQGNLYNTKGYGLGLYYVKTLIERHKGEITVKSSAKEGTDFIIKLPVE